MSQCGILHSRARGKGPGNSETTCCSKGERGFGSIGVLLSSLELFRFQWRNTSFHGIHRVPLEKALPSAGNGSHAQRGVLHPLGPPIWSRQPGHVNAGGHRRTSANEALLQRMLKDGVAAGGVAEGHLPCPRRNCLGSGRCKLALQRPAWIKQVRRR